MPQTSSADQTPVQFCQFTEGSTYSGYTTNTAPLRVGDKFINIRDYSQWPSPSILLARLPPCFCLEEVYIARHYYDSSKQEKYPWLRHIVSLIIVGRPGVMTEAVDRFAKADIGVTALLADDVDHRPRLGLTVSLTEPGEYRRLETALDIIKSLTSNFSQSSEKAIAMLLNPHCDLSSENIKSLTSNFSRTGKQAVTMLLNPNCDPSLVFSVGLGLQWITTRTDEKIHNAQCISDKSLLVFKPISVSSIPAGDLVARFFRLHSQIPTEVPLIHQAILSGDINTVRWILKSDPLAILSIDPLGKRALALAIGMKQLDIKRLAVQAYFCISDKSILVFKPMNVFSWTMGDSVVSFDRRWHAQIPREVPPLHQAILSGNIKTVREILKHDPAAILLIDPWGQRALELAIEMMQLEIMELATQAHCSLKLPWHEHERQRVSQSLVPAFTNGDMEEKTRANESMYAEKINLKYREKQKNPKLVRSKLHQDIIDGDTASAKQILTADPTRLQEPDPLGFTPLILALAAGNLELAQWLIEQGVPVEDVRLEGTAQCWYRASQFRLMDNASTPKVMELILHYHTDPHHINDRLSIAIQQNDAPLVKCLLFYIKDMPNYKGLSPLELAIQLHIQDPKYLEIIKLLLQHTADLLPVGPYNQEILPCLQRLDPRITPEKILPLAWYAIPEDIALLFKAHNERLRKKRLEKSARPKFIDSHIEIDPRTGSSKIISHFLRSSAQATYFKLPILAIRGELIRMKDLTKEQWTKLRVIFDKTFGIAATQTDLSREDYFKSAFTEKSEVPGYIQLFYDDNTGEIVSFLTIDLEAATLPPDSPLIKSVGAKFLVFHAKLAGNLPNYASLGLTQIGFIHMVALHQHYQTQEQPPLRHFCFIKAIPPGFGLCLLSPFMQYYPKYYIPRGLIDYVCQELIQDPNTGDSSFLGQATIRCKLEIDLTRQAAPTANKQLAYFNHVVPGKDNAMVIFFPLHNPRCRAALLDEVRENGINSQYIDQLAKHWDVLLSESDSKPNRRFTSKL